MSKAERILKHPASVVTLIVWSFLNLFAVEGGLLNGLSEARAPRKQWRKIEYIVPGYRLGYWLAQ